MEKIFQISDNIHGLVSCSQLEKEMIASVPFNRLHFILQNSTAFKTFPSNQTSRLSHSLGAMNLAGKMILSSIINADSTTISHLSTNVEREIKNILQDKQSDLRGVIETQFLKDFYRDPLHTKLEIELDDAFYKSIHIRQSKDISNFALLVLIQSIRCAALFHDIGHPPFSHIVEFALSDLYYKYNKAENQTMRIREFLNILAPYKGADATAELHEEIGKKLTDRVLERLYKDQCKKNSETALFYFIVWNFTMKILKAKSITEIKATSEDYISLFSDIHEIISGHMDCDRLDYIVRDVVNSGFNKGIIEYDRLIKSSKLQHLEIIPYSNSKQFIISYDIRCLNTVEDFFRRRWCLYKEIIYHHRVRKTDALLQKLVFKIGDEYLSQTVDNQFHDASKALTIDISGLWKAIEVFFSTDDLFNSTIQWKDNWLISSLEKYYFDQENKDPIVTAMLDEILKNKKKYYSRIKRVTDFDILDSCLHKSLCTFLDQNPRIEESVLRKSDDPKFFFRQVVVSLFNTHKQSLERNHFTLERILNDAVNETQQKLGIDDTLLIFNKSKNAEAFTVYFHNYSECNHIDQYSLIQNELQLSEISYPAFYLFTTDYTEESSEKTKVILETLAYSIGNKLQNVLEKLYSEEIACDQEKLIETIDKVE